MVTYQLLKVTGFLLYNPEKKEIYKRNKLHTYTNPEDFKALNSLDYL